MSSAHNPQDADAGARDFVKQSSLYQEFLAEREEILKHKWLESERLGYDIGFERALLDWIRKHRDSWRAARRAQTGAGRATKAPFADPLKKSGAANTTPLANSTAPTSGATSGTNPSVQVGGASAGGQVAAVPATASSASGASGTTGGTKSADADKTRIALNGGSR